MIAGKWMGTWCLPVGGLGNGKYGNRLKSGGKGGGIKEIGKHGKEIQTYKEEKYNIYMYTPALSFSNQGGPVVSSQGKKAQEKFFPHRWSPPYLHSPIPLYVSPILHTYCPSPMLHSLIIDLILEVKGGVFFVKLYFTLEST